MTHPPGKGRSLSPGLAGGALRPGATQPRRTHRPRRLINTGAGRGATRRDGTEASGGPEPGWPVRTGRPRISSHIDVKLLNQRPLLLGAPKEMRFLARLSQEETLLTRESRDLGHPEELLL